MGELPWNIMRWRWSWIRRGELGWKFWHSYSPSTGNNWTCWRFPISSCSFLFFPFTSNFLYSDRFLYVSEFCFKTMLCLEFFGPFIWFIPLEFIPLISFVSNLAMSLLRAVTTSFPALRILNMRPSYFNTTDPRAKASWRPSKLSLALFSGWRFLAGFSLSDCRYKGYHLRLIVPYAASRVALHFLLFIGLVVVPMVSR